MIAGLLYLIGLLTVLVTLVMVGYGAPGLIQTFTNGLDAGTDGLLSALGSMAASLGWAVTPFISGLALMGFGRIITLLASINRSLRGGS